MFKVNKPNKPLNSAIFNAETGYELFMIENNLFISGCDSLEEAEAALERHNPPTPSEPTIEDKLASVGLKIDDLKAALGL